MVNVPGWTLVPGSSGSGTIMSCRFAKDGHYALGSDGGKIKLFDSSHNQLWVHSAGGSVYVTGVAFSPDSNYLLTSWSSSNQKVAIFGIGSSTPDTTIDKGGDNVYGVDWNEDGSVFTCADKTSPVKIYNGTNGYFNSSIKSLSDPTSEMMSVDFSTR